MLQVVSYKLQEKFMENMKIIITTPLYLPEIAEPAPYTKEAGTILSQYYDVSILTYSNIRDHSPDSKITTILKNQPTIIKLLRYFYKLFVLSRNHDLIYAQGGISTSLPSVLVGLINSKRVVFRFNEDEAWERSKRLGLFNENLEVFLSSPPKNIRILFIKYLQSFVLRNSHTIIVPSGYFQKLILKYYHVPIEKIKIVHNPAPKEIFLPFPAQKVPGQIVAPGEYLSENDLSTLIKAVSQLRNEFPNIRLKITGDISDKAIEQSESVDLLGVTGVAEKFYLLKTSAVQIINTSIKNNPDILFAGYIAKTITICKNTDGLNEGLLNNVSGLLLETDEAEELKEKIRNIFSNQELRERLMGGGLDILKNEFSWECHIKKLDKIFHEQK